VVVQGIQILTVGPVVRAVYLCGREVLTLPGGYRYSTDIHVCLQNELF